MYVCTCVRKCVACERWWEVFLRVIGTGSEQTNLHPTTKLESLCHRLWQHRPLRRERKKKCGKVNGNSTIARWTREGERSPLYHPTLILKSSRDKTGKGEALIYVYVVRNFSLFFSQSYNHVTFYVYINIEGKKIIKFGGMKATRALLVADEKPANGETIDRSIGASLRREKRRNITERADVK